MFRNSILAAALVAAAFPAAADAAATMTITDIDGSVRAILSGSLDNRGLTLFGNTDASSLFRAAPMYLGFAGKVDVYGVLSGATTLGTSHDVTLSSLTVGTAFVLYATNTNVFVGLPGGYVSGSPLSSVSTFSNTTVAGLGLNAGSYVYRLPNDTLTVNIVPQAAAVPEPATWATLVVGFGLMGAAMRRRAPRVLAA